MDCLLCKIIAGDIPSTKVYEDETVYAFRDIAPQAPTHILVVPKAHIPSVDGINAENSAVVAHIFEVIPAIAKAENLDEALCRRLVICGLVHDIGIKPADEKFGRHEGPLQEQEGPAAAQPLLERCGLDPQEIERQCWLIAHHHTYDNVMDIDHRILLEADFLVNAYEGGLPAEAIASMREKVFRTPTGIRLLNTMFGL